MGKIDTSKLRTFDAAEYLQSDEDIAQYLNAALEDPVMLPAALRTVARAKGINQIATETAIPLKTLYRALNGESGLKLETLHKIATALGVSLQFTTLENAANSSSNNETETV